MTQQLPIASLRVNQHPNERNKQQRISSVSHRYSVWVAIDGKIAALCILIVGRLIKPDVMMRINLIHRHFPFLLILSIHNRKLRNIVRSRIRSLMIIHIESIKTNLKRQILQLHPHLLVLIQILLRRFIHSQMYDSLIRTEMSNQSTQQNHYKGKMQTNGGESLHSLLQKISDCHSSTDAP